jgi:hypothetical protein
LSGCCLTPSVQHLAIIYLHGKGLRTGVAIDKVYQLLARGRWFFPGNPASSTTKTGRHDIAESGVKHKKSNQINLF